MISQNYPGPNEFRTGIQGAAIGSGDHQAGSTVGKTSASKASKTKIVVQAGPKTGIFSHRPKTT